MREFHNLITFANGSIGDFLMWLDFFEACHEQNPTLRCVLIRRRKAGLLREIARPYHFVSFLTLDDGVLVFLQQLFLLCGTKNLVILPYTFGTPSSLLIQMGKVLTLRSGSRFLAFNPIRGVETVPFDLTRCYYENLRSVFPALGLAPVVRPPRYRFSPTTVSPEIPRPYVVVHPFAGNSVRTLPQARWVDLIRFLRATFPQLHILITGAPGEASAAGAIIRALGTTEHIFQRAGTFKFHELAAVLTNAQLYIGVDSGITHLASLLGKRSLVIGNLSNPTWLPRYNADAVILTEKARCSCTGSKRGDCFAAEDGKVYFRCMLDVPQARIHAEAARMLRDEASRQVM